MGRARFNFTGSKILKEYRILFALLILLTFFSIAIETLSIGLIVPFLNSVLETQTPSHTHGWIIEALNKFVDRLSHGNLFTTTCVVFFVLVFIKIVFKVGRDALKVIFIQKIKVDGQRAMFEKNINADMQFFIQHKSGDLAFRVVNLPTEVSVYFTLLPALCIEAINILLMSVLLLSVSPILFGIIFIIGSIFGVVVWGMSKRVFEKAGRECTDAQTWQSIIVNESLAGIREIITYGKRKEWAKRFWQQCQRYYGLKVRISILRLVPGSLLEIFVVGGVSLVGIFYGLNNPEAAREMLPVISIYALVMVKMIPSFSQISQDQTQLAALKPAVRLYEKYLSEPTHEREEKEDSLLPAVSFNRDIRFEQVSFAYVPHKFVVEDLNLTIPKNKTVAIVGGSGVGKSTLMDLLLGLYEVQEGRILIDGEDLRKFSLSHWRALIGVVSQNSTIFNATIKENIALDFNAVDMRRIQELAQVAGVHEFVSHLKDGYDTELGDRGFKLSGGQRQRIAIARALYRNPPIVIFDEATSALDYRTEKLIHEAMTSLLRFKTVIILAHRLSTIEVADIIYVLKDQGVSQVGTHAELLQQQGEYAELYQREIVQATTKKLYGPDNV